MESKISETAQKNHELLWPGYQSRTGATAPGVMMIMASTIGSGSVSENSPQDSILFLGLDFQDTFLLYLIIVSYNFPHTISVFAICTSVTFCKYNLSS